MNSITLPATPPSSNGSAASSSGGGGAELVLIRAFNDAHVERQARYGEAIAATREAAHAETARSKAERRHLGALQVLEAERAAVEDRRRRAPLVLMWALVGLGLVLDATACWLAAQVFNGDRTSSVIITGLLLAFLAGGEAAMDLFTRRGSHRLWGGTVVVVVLFVVALGLLRYQYLMTVDGDRLSAVLGAALLTAITGGLVALGYLALRHAEPFVVFLGKRGVRRERRAAAACGRRAERAEITRIRRHDAYLSIIRPDLLKAAPNQEELDLLERRIRRHLCWIPDGGLTDVPEQGGRG